MNQDFGYYEKGQQGRIGDLRLWRRIFTYVRPQQRAVGIAILLSLAIIVTNLALPHLVRLAMDNYITKSQLPLALRLSGIGKLALLFVALILGGFAANYFQVTVLERAGQNIMHELRQRLFRHLLELELAFFNQHAAGKLVTRLTNDIQNMHEMFTSVIVTLCNDFLQIVVILAILFWMDWHLAWLMTALLPLVGLNTFLFSRFAREIFREMRSRLARINGHLQEALSGLTLIQSFNREKLSLEQFDRQNEDYFHKTITQIKIFGVFMPMVEILGAMAVATIVCYGGREVIKGEITLGMLTAFLSYMRLFFQPIREFSQKYSVVQSAMASAERIFQLLDTESTLASTASSRQPERVAGEIAIRGVDFAYKAGQKILADFSLTIAAGEALAIVGPTGSGKSTLINLLERLYDPSRGTITLDGIPLQELEQKWLRRQIGLVMQDVFVIPGTIRENILLDQVLAPEELAEIIEKAQLKPLLAKLPLGLETMIGEGGSGLSSGQNQLLAFARVLARQPRILILDEATANVDTETELLIEKAIAATLPGRTSIVIAHRLSTIRRADRIVVMAEGRIEEEGNHEELMARQGLYHALLTLPDNERRVNGRPLPPTPG